MNLSINLPLYYFKPNFVKIINRNLFEYYLIKGSKELMQKIIKSNKRTKKYFLKYSEISSYISYSLLNNIFLQYYSSSLSDFLFNLIKISSFNNNLPLSSIESFSFTKSLYLITKFIQPIILEKIRKKNFGIFFIKGIKLTNIILKLLYMIKDDFMYCDIFDYIFGIMSLNNYKEKNDKENIEVYFSFVVFFGIISYQCYEKIKKKEIEKEKEKKNKIKIINEVKKNEVIPIPDIKYYLSRNKNFLKMINNKKGLCLICNKKFNSPTAIKCCGGVFCYKCIFNYLIIHQKCYLCLQKLLFTNNNEIDKILIKIYS